MNQELLCAHLGQTPASHRVLGKGTECKSRVKRKCTPRGCSMLSLPLLHPKSITVAAPAPPTPKSVVVQSEKGSIIWMTKISSQLTENKNIKHWKHFLDFL